MSEHVREWYAQIAEASKTPGLAQHLVRRTGELFPRFASFYDRLRALPRRLRRAIGGRRRGFSLAGVAMLLALCNTPLQARVFMVNEICSLPNAIIAANTDVGTFGCPNGAGDDVIILKTDVVLTAPLPAITSTLTIKAGTHSIIDGAGNACFDVAAGDDEPVVLDGLTIRNCTNTFGNGNGGAVDNDGRLTIRNSTITGNHARFGGGISSDGDLTVEHSTISGNSADVEGGGIDNGGNLTIVDSVVSGNTAVNSGGGMDIGLYYTSRIIRTEISGNEAGFFGGGIRVDTYASPVVEIEDCTITGNTAGARGGGIASLGGFTGGGTVRVRGTTISGNTADDGGGIASVTGEDPNLIRIEQSTISGNTATSRGGGIYHTNGFCNLFPDVLSLVNATVSNNTSGEEGGGVFIYCRDLELSHSLIVGNDAPTGAELSIRRPTKVTLSEFNVVGYDGRDRSKNFSPGPTDIVPARGVQVEDILAPLEDNGGLTPTHALVPGSPAVDAIPVTEPGCVGTTDQRGVPRPVGPGCDAGSVEADPP